jgi:DNA-binding winged helix-turn-helix (wHTH) protein
MPSTSQVLMFDNFRFNVATHELLRVGDGAGAPILLGSRAADLLLLLLRRPGELVAKNEIMEAVWPNAVMQESNLPVQISALRRALDAGRSGASSIQTVPGRGYRFTLRVTGYDEAETGLPVIASGARTPDAVEPSCEVSGRVPEFVPAGGIVWTAKWRRFGAAAVAVLLCATVVVVYWRGFFTDQPVGRITERPAPLQPDKLNQSAEPAELAPRPQPPSFAAVAIDLSGTWHADNGGVYAIKQSGSAVTWEAVSGDNGATWTHTFNGVIQDNVINGRFFDRPPGRGRNAADLTLKIVDNEHLLQIGSLQCGPGLVPREAFVGDRVCASSAVHDQTIADNITAPSRTLPNGLCIPDYVWRRAIPGDRVCVTTTTRDRTRSDNMTGTSSGPFGTRVWTRAISAQP